MQNLIYPQLENYKIPYRQPLAWHYGIGGLKKNNLPLWKFLGFKNNNLLKLVLQLP